MYQAHVHKVALRSMAARREALVRLLYRHLQHLVTFRPLLIPLLAV